MSQAESGFGVQFREGDGTSPEVFAAIEELLDFDNLGIESDEAEVTHHASPGRFREFISTLKRGVQIAVSCNRIIGAVVQNSVRDKAGDGLIHNFQLSAPDNDEVFTFPGVVLGWSWVSPKDSQRMINFTIRIAGEIIIT